MDLVYRPRLTHLLADAAAAGASATMNGEVMLLHQGAAAFELWTGQAAPLELMRAQLDAGLASDDVDDPPDADSGAEVPAAKGGAPEAVSAGESS